MSSLPTTGLARKTGTVILGVTVLSSLLLTGCSPASQTNDSAPNPTAATANADAPQGVTKFKSAAFDLSKQVSVDVKKEDSNIYLAGGVVTSDQDTVIYTPYEDKDEAWDYTLQKPLSSMRVSPMHWKGKSYLVISGWDENSKEASGLTAAKKTTAEVTTVLDATDGAMVVTLKGDESEVGAAPDSTFYLEVSSILDSTAGDTKYVESTFLTGLVFKNGEGKYKLVDPTSGATVATGERNLSAPMRNNEAGFYQYDNTDYGITPAKPQAKATFGNYALLATAQPEYQTKTGSYVKNSTYSLVDTVTKKTVSEMKCADGGMPQETSYSPDFRYVSFFGNYVFDTKTGKSFCTIPVGKEDVRKFYVTDIDNAGSMYGFADTEYLRISLEDNSKIETLLPDFSSQNELPVRITDKGSAVFFSEQSEDTLVSVPAKATSED